jgi:hypothetical protein
MKSIRMVILVVGVVFSPHLLRAQTATVGSFNGDIMQVQLAQTDSIVSIVAEAQGLQLVPPDQLPLYGTFWTVLPGPGGGVIPPFPCPPLDPSLPIYAIADGQFLVDGTIGGQATLNTPQAGRLAAGSTSAAGLGAQADAVVNLITQVQTAAVNQQMRTMARAMGMDAPMPGDGGSDGGSNNYSNFTSSHTIDTNDLYLEVTGISNGAAWFNLHNATNQVYAITSKTNLLSAGWNIEREVWPDTNQTVTPFTVPVLDRTEALFVWARDWTGVTSDGNETPEWWLWEFFGTTALSDTNLDGFGVSTLLEDYQNGIDPNPILFSLQFPGKVETNIVNGTVMIFGGTPFYLAVLVNDTNEADASWQPYAGTNITVSLNAGDGVYTVRVGLRGLPDNAQQTWLGTKLTLFHTVAPTFVITTPVSTMVSTPMIQLQGFVNETLNT